MLKIKLIGVGAAGGKAVITAIEQGAVRREQSMILNSTFKDVPDEYKDIFIQYKDSLGGCGKEREKAKELVMNSLQSQYIPLDSWIDPDDDLIVIVTSTEGGTGSGSVPVIARYINEVLEFNVEAYALVGFEDDARGLQNTINFFQDLTENISVQSTVNSKFLDGTGNRKKAEAAANIEFAERLKILQGQMIVDSEQNIDETDLFKLSTQTGYIQIEYVDIEEKIKNKDMFNQLLNTMLDESKSLETIAACKRLGVIMNVNDRTLDHVDHSFNVLRERLGQPYEFYKHIQSVDNKEYICVISSGMKMPIDEVKQVYERYKTQTNMVNKKSDSFFDTMAELKDNSEDAMFNSASGYRKKKSVSDQSKSNFFNSLKTEKENKDNKAKIIEEINNKINKY